MIGTELWHAPWTPEPNTRRTALSEDAPSGSDATARLSRAMAAGGTNLPAHRAGEDVDELVAGACAGLSEHRVLDLSHVT